MPGPGDVGAPTSGGSGDSVLVENTFATTGTGTSGVVVATGGLRRIEDGFDKGDYVPVSEVPTRDARADATLTRMTDLLISELQSIVMQLRSSVQVTNRPARAANVYGVQASTASVQVVAPGLGRRGVRIANDSTASSLYLRVGGSPASNAINGYSVVLTAGSYYEVPAWDTEQSIFGIWASGNGTGWANVTESW